MTQSNTNKEEKKNMLPRVIRHDRSGVWICYIKGPGFLPNTIEIEGRRVWSWSGGRLECSQIAHRGATAEDKLGDWITNDLAVGEGDGLVDVLHSTEEIVEACRRLPVYEC